MRLFEDPLPLADFGLAERLVGGGGGGGGARLQRDLQALGEGLGGEHPGAGCAGGRLDLPVGADHAPGAGRPAKGSEEPADGLVGSGGLGHEVGAHPAEAPETRLGGWGAIEIDLRPVPALLAEPQQELEQAPFVIGHGEREPRQFGDQVVTVDNIIHNDTR